MNIRIRIIVLGKAEKKKTEVCNEWEKGWVENNQGASLARTSTATFISHSGESNFVIITLINCNDLVCNIKLDDVYCQRDNPFVLL